ncbi:lipopolysaccharide transport periplasmic protein LptA [Roseovarius sp. TE539]|uniref:LptA/OstA family protein n=1 Tax=Roseovarius sp. TE539 TaxID=2249812 RepID=UPI000DDDEBEA|nr:LptA/OstA family protein [Roseovarius sp. TE539]RBI67589.1 lipopolysaccharide transport periplasmic protein LptA [Roseovarius sp. TE539]
MSSLIRISANFPLLALCFAVAFTVAAPACAQGAQVAFGKMREESGLPVEVTSESLAVDQEDGTAIFTGNVVIGQGEMRLSAPRVEVIYQKDGSGIASLHATGGVTLVSGEDAAESAEADYIIESGVVRMRGSVLLVQGRAALSGDRMTVDTVAGTARMTGNVNTVLQQEADE